MSLAALELRKYPESKDMDLGPTIPQIWESHVKTAKEHIEILKAVAVKEDEEGK